MKKILYKAAPFLLILLFCLPLITQAVGFDPYGQIENVDLGKPTEEEVPYLVVLIINIVLGFLALIAVILIIYAGIAYMISGGNAEKMKRARDILLATVIGLLIIAIAWAVTVYVINTLNVATSSIYTPPT